MLWTLLRRDGRFVVVNGCGGIEGLLYPHVQLGVVLSGAPGQALRLATEIGTFDGSPHESSPCRVLAGEYLAEEAERRRSLSSHKLAESP